MKLHLFLCISIISFWSYSQGYPDQWPTSSGTMDFSRGEGEFLLHISPLSIATIDAMANGRSLLTGTTSTYTVNYNPYLIDPFKERNIVNLFTEGIATSIPTHNTQSLLIVPHPESIYKYYLIGNNYGTYPIYDLIICEFDFRLNSGAGGIVNGSIRRIEQEVFPRNMMGYFNKEDGSYWIIIQRNDSTDFLSYKIDSNGFNPTPVVSSVAYNSFSTVYSVNVNLNSGTGKAVVSPDGSKIAIVNSINKGILHLYDFDSTTGVISNNQNIGRELVDEERYTNAAFSGDSSKLYVLTQDRSQPFYNAGHGIQFSNLRSKVFQYDLSLSNISQIIASETQISNDVGPDNYFARYNSLFLAVDGRIYAPGGTWLARVDNPNLLGLTSNFIDNYQNNTSDFNYGQPIRANFITNTIVEYIEVGDQCLGSLTNFSLTENVTQVSWDFNDPASGVNNTSTSLTPNHQFTAAGKYRVVATAIVNGLQKEFVRYIRIFDPPLLSSPIDPFTGCDYDGNGIASFDLNRLTPLVSRLYKGEKLSFYATQTDALNRTNEIDTNISFVNQTPYSQSLFLVVDNRYGCSSTIELSLITKEYSPIPNDFILDITVCVDQGSNGSVVDLTVIESEVANYYANTNNFIFNYYENRQDAILQRNSINLPSAYEFNSTNSQSIIVSIIHPDTYCDLIAVPLIRLNTIEVTVEELSDVYELCSGDTLNLEVDDSYLSYSWSNGSTTYQSQFSSYGMHSLTVEKLISGAICSSTFNFEIVPTSPPVIDDIIIDSVNKSVTVQMASIGDFVYTIPNVASQSSNVFQNLEYGEYEISVHEIPDCGTVTKTFNLIGYPRFFTPNQDGFNDTWNILGSKSNEVYITSIFDRYGKLLSQVESDEIGWDGTFNGSPMPGSDYWFKTVKNNVVVFQGHFALKR
ncbi:T9SS type B sorting domain-containing protein [Nonlabens sp. Asnod2-A12]|uniref:T9SS type B sorting domain-containing protein n=1 Tax=Nonlabens sp. Asnod2-A12 TaxID=3160578 RepID=UPI00386BC6D4